MKMLRVAYAMRILLMLAVTSCGNVVPGISEEPQVVDPVPPKSAQPAPVPTFVAKRVTAGLINVRGALATPSSTIVKAIGYAEGTLTVSGSPTKAYYGHNDSNRRNIGIFSCTVCGSRGAIAADMFFLTKNIHPWIDDYERAATQAGFEPGHPMLAATFFTLFTQSPLAATQKRGFLERMRELKSLGLTMTNLINTCVESYRTPETGKFDNVPGFQNNVTRLRADQTRRLQAVEASLRYQGINPWPK